MRERGRAQFGHGNMECDYRNAISVTMSLRWHFALRDLFRFRRISRKALVISQCAMGQHAVNGKRIFKARISMSENDYNCSTNSNVNFSSYRNGLNSNVAIQSKMKKKIQRLKFALDF